MDANSKSTRTLNAHFNPRPTIILLSTDNLISPLNLYQCRLYCYGGSRYTYVFHTASPALGVKPLGGQNRRATMSVVCYPTSSGRDARRCSGPSGGRRFSGRSVPPSPRRRPDRSPPPRSVLEPSPRPPSRRNPPPPAAAGGRASPPFMGGSMGGSWTSSAFQDPQRFCFFARWGSEELRSWEGALGSVRAEQARTSFLCTMWRVLARR